jgi:hypothetical protein
MFLFMDTESGLALCPVKERSDLDAESVGLTGLTM